MATKSNAEILAAIQQSNEALMGVLGNLVQVLTTNRPSVSPEPMPTTTVEPTNTLPAMLQGATFGTPSAKKGKVKAKTFEERLAKTLYWSKRKAMANKTTIGVWYASSKSDPAGWALAFDWAKKQHPAANQALVAIIHPDGRIESKLAGQQFNV